MHRILRWLRHEVLQVIPIFLFFFAVLNLRNITNSLVYGSAVANPHRELTLAVFALIIAKVLLLADLLPFVETFSHKPLIFTTLWKTLIYALAALLYRLGDALIPFLRRERELSAAWQQLRVETNWSRFWGIQLWLTALLLLFVAARELILAIGGGRALGRLFFRQKAA